MTHPTADRPIETAGLVISTPRRYDLRLLLHTRGRERKFRDELVGLARITRGETVLDIGCGTGSFAIAAGRAVGPSGSVTAVDPSPEMVGHARAKAGRAGSSAVFATAAIEALPFPDASFDVVTITLVMHQLPSEVLHQGMAEVLRVMRPGGRLFVVDMGGLQPEGRRTAHAPHGQHDRHGAFDLEKVVMFFDHLGLETLASGPVEFPLIYLERLRYVLARRGGS